MAQMASPVRQDRKAWPVLAVLLLALLLVVVVARDGAPVWREGRVAVVLFLCAGAVAVLQRGPAVARAATGFLVGLVGIAVGLGLGAPHLVKQGLGANGVLGVLAFAAGLALAGGGAAALVRAVPGWWGRAVVIVVLLVVTYLVVWPAAFAIAATNVPRTPLAAERPDDLGLTYVDARFTTADGVTLSGWYVPSSNGAAVVLLHGAGSTRSSVLDEAAVLADHGYGVLLYDARGHGRSGGRAMDFGWYGDEDLAAAVDHVAAQPDVDPGRIAALGLSMGGEEALGAAAADPRIRAVVAEGATGRVAADHAWLSDEYGLRGSLQEGIERLLYSTTDLLTDADPPPALRDAVARADADVLLITAGDLADEGHAADHIAGGAPSRATVWDVEGAGHTEGLETQPEAWEEQVTDFLARTLGSRQQRGP
jgi:pimeloyl-ACP methyl ester carboxylesterase